jgi:hypothetical protein
MDAITAIGPDFFFFFFFSFFSLLLFCFHAAILDLPPHVLLRKRPPVNAFFWGLPRRPSNVEDTVLLSAFSPIPRPYNLCHTFKIQYVFLQKNRTYQKQVCFELRHNDTVRSSACTFHVGKQFNSRR